MSHPFISLKSKNLADSGPIRIRVRCQESLTARLKYIASKMLDEDGKPLPYTDLARRYIADGVTRDIGRV